MILEMGEGVSQLKQFPNVSEVTSAERSAA
jgi:hypothetical protein